MVDRREGLVEGDLMVVWERGLAKSRRAHAAELENPGSGQGVVNVSVMHLASGERRQILLGGRRAVLVERQI